MTTLPLHRRQLAALAVAALWAAPARALAAPPEVAARWPDARRIGRSPMRWLGLAVYDAQLWSPASPTREDWAMHPFALELVYARALSGPRIADRSLAEIRRQGPIEAATAERWLATLRASFPDVHPGDRLTGIHQPGEGAQLHFNGRLKSQWQDLTLTRQFFGIWLAEQTSEPELREGLFGGRG